MAIDLSNILTNPGQLYNGFYPKRPVWGILATTNDSTPNSTNNFFYTFNRRNPATPQSFDYMAGSSQANVALGRRIGSSETSTSYYYAGSSGSQIGSSSWSPTQGFIGCQNIGQTGANISFDANDTGYSHFYRTDFHSGLTYTVSGVVIGEPNWNQTFDLIAWDGKIMKLPIGVSQRYIDTPSTNADFFFASQQVYAGVGLPTGVGGGLGSSGMTSDATTGSNANARRNRGMICHNRRSGKLAYMEATSTTGQYRLHIIDIRNKIGADTTTQEILEWINAAVSAGSSRYNFYTLNFPVSQPMSQLQMQQVRLVLCDDDTLWVRFWDKDDSSNGGFNRLYRCTNTSTYAPVQVSTQSTTTSYGLSQGNQYGQRHMNSDDNSRVAIYNPYYYYLSGINCHIVNTYTAVDVSTTTGTRTQWMGFADTSSTGGYPLVPTGGNGFFVGRHWNNADGATGIDGQYFNTTVLAGQTMSYTSNTLQMLPTINQSTSYQAWVPIKVQPTLEWKPAND
jgi:hypothetical protein